MTERKFRLTEVSEVAACSTADVENWIRRLPLTASKNKVGRGQTRLFSESETMEISFLAALTKCGISPRKAHAIASSWLVLDRKGTLPEFWLLPDASAESAREQTFEQIQHAFTTDYPRDPYSPIHSARAVVSIITVRRIKMRVASYHDDLRRRIKTGEERPKYIVFPK
jgi:hypothetical protein